MHETPGRSVGPSSRYTVLALNVAKLARRLETRDVEPIEGQVLNRAADFVAGIIQGSLFVEGRGTSGLSNARESLFTVDHAIAALEQLTLEPEQAKHLTTIFQEYETDLRSLASGKKIAKERLAALREFFDALAALFYQDVADSAFGGPHVASRFA
jgi:hypothetical protein